MDPTKSASSSEERRACCRMRDGERRAAFAGHRSARPRPPMFILQWMCRDRLQRLCTQPLRSDAESREPVAASRHLASFSIPVSPSTLPCSVSSAASCAPDRDLFFASALNSGRSADPGLVIGVRGSEQCQRSSDQNNCSGRSGGAAGIAMAEPKQTVGSMETTHGLIRLVVPSPQFRSYLRLPNRLGYFNMELAPRSYAQIFYCLAQRGRCARLMMPLLMA